MHPAVAQVVDSAHGGVLPMFPAKVAGFETGTRYKFRADSACISSHLVQHIQFHRGFLAGWVREEIEKL